VSTGSAARAPRPSQTAAGRRAQAALRVVPRSTQRASTGTFALVVAAVLTLGLLGLLALNTVMAQNAFAARDLVRKQAVLTAQEQALQQQVAVLQSPQELAARATALGMVVGQNPVFLNPANGKVLGVPVPARAPVVVSPPAPTATTGKPPAVTKPAATTPGTTVTTKPGTTATTPATTAAGTGR
jgi:hypothetical protein